jgi:SAM-dependent methyltransferase
MHEYGADFYSFLSSFAIRSARTVVPIVAGALPIASVADFGCGHGAWLSIWQETGAEIVGLDGPYVDRTRLLIPASAFRPADLAAPLDLGRRFDLVQSLETAEHLPPSAAQQFVRTLVHHADHVLFSAAVPGQGGEHHVNEQKLEFWRALFAAEGYRPVDIIRPAVRGNPAVQRWYRCNTILYVNLAGLSRLSAAAQQYVVGAGQPLAEYWPLSSRIRQRILQVLPQPAVDRLAQLNAALLARHAKLSHLMTAN